MSDSFATPRTIVQGLPGGSVGGASSTGDPVAQPCSTGDSGLIPGWGRSLDEGVATHSSWTESLVGYSLLLLLLSHLSRVRLCDPTDGSPPGSPVPGILQARTLEWVAIAFSQRMKVKSESDVAQSCPTL